jgi:hypothetical protein
MPDNAEYRSIDLGRWRLVYLDGFWNESAQKTIMETAQAQPWAKHPQTLALRLGAPGGEQDLYLKIFHPASRIAAWKDGLRGSKAFRAWQIGLRLRRAGFSVPVTVAAGEERRAGPGRPPIIVAQKVDGVPAHLFLRARAGDARWSAEKRARLKQAAELVRRFHDAGFVHGDLVPTNLLVVPGNNGIQLFFMDNDRTRHYPTWLPQPFWKRNLIQLNRMPLPGITLQDRMRFFKAYRRAQKVDASDRALAQWLERATRRRRAECDGVDGSGDFRRLMQCSVEIAASAKAKTIV